MVLTYRGSTTYCADPPLRPTWIMNCLASLTNCNKCTHHTLFLLVSVSYSSSACIKNSQLNGLGMALCYASVLWWTQSEKTPFNIVTCLCCCKHSHIIAACPEAWWSQNKIETKSPVHFLNGFWDSLQRFTVLQNGTRIRALWSISYCQHPITFFMHTHNGI